MHMFHINTVQIRNIADPRLAQHCTDIAQTCLQSFIRTCCSVAHPRKVLPKTSENAPLRPQIVQIVQIVQHAFYV